MAVGLGVIILFVSMARAGLNLMAEDGAYAGLKNDEIKFLKNFADGETLAGTYKLPQTGMLPSNILYGFKRVRDFLWITFSQGNEKVKVALLIADKKAVEFEKLAKDGNRNLAIESGNEAIDRLEYSDGLIKQLKITDAQLRQFRSQILWAGFAYSEIFTRNKGEYEMDQENYSKLINRIDDWNKNQEKTRFTWNY